MERILSNDEFVDALNEQVYDSTFMELGRKVRLVICRASDPFYYLMNQTETFLDYLCSSNDGSAGEETVDFAEEETEELN